MHGQGFSSYLNVFCLFVCLFVFFLRRYERRSTKTFPPGLFVCFQSRNFPSEVY